MNHEQIFCPYCGSKMAAEVKEVNSMEIWRFKCQNDACLAYGPFAKSQDDAMEKATHCFEHCWKNVRQILPKPYESVFCLCKNGKIMVAKLDPYEGAWVDFESCKIFYFDYVTHWLPIPSLPEPTKPRELEYKTFREWDEEEKRLQKRLRK